MELWLILMVANLLSNIAILLFIAGTLSKIHTEQKNAAKHQAKLNHLIISRTGARQSSISNIATKSPPLEYKPTDRRRRG